MSFGKPVEKVEKAVEKSGESGIINLHDDSTDYKPVTQKSIDSVPLLKAFDDEAMNAAHQEACRDLLREVMRHDEVPVGTEFSIVYDKDMKHIQGHNYHQGVKGKTEVDDPSIPYHAFHNHGSGNTFSFPDLLNFSERENMYSLSAVGNNGKTFLLFATNISDKQAFSELLSSVSNEIIFTKNNQDITVDWLYNGNNRTEVIEFINQLSPKENKQLQNAILEKTTKCLEGAEKYGIKYFKT